MKNYFLLLLISVCFCKTSLTQKLSLNEFLNLRNMPLSNIDSLMANKKFTRSDTFAGDLNFRFYGYLKQAKIPEIRYLQLALKSDESFAEIQYQTSLQTESNSFQQQLISYGFKKIKDDLDEGNFSFSKKDFIILYSTEALNKTSGIVLYTFSIRDNNKTNNAPLFRQTNTIQATHSININNLYPSFKNR